MEGKRPSGPQHGGALKAWVRALEKTQPIAGQPHVTFPVVIDRLAERFGDAPALLSDAACLSYAELAGRAQGYARWGLRQGLAKGDVVALLMPNCPDFLAFWLGITRIGGVVALLNTQLTGPSLAHCITVAAPRCIVVGQGLAAAFDAVQGQVGGALDCWVHGQDHAEHRRLEPALQDGAPDPPADAAPTVHDRALLIYTSGTTGLPKAAIVSHFRLMQWTHWFAGMLDMRPEDRMYNCLPMYHSVGGVVATGAMLVNGGSVVLRERFSASAFWDDVVRWDCTMFQYIGEFCRYLANSPAHPKETRHRLRLACGNGLRPDVWDRFQRRFEIPAIVEFYASTEGSFSLFNVEGKPGAIGRIPKFLAHRFPVSLVRIDPDTSEPVRGADGLCVSCPTGEAGEAIGKVARDRVGEGGVFEGYTDPAATSRKLLRDVFAPGDTWFRTGDLMRKDTAGFFAFVDRLGDTFRWKGENVAASEVEQALGAYPGVIEAAVYGVLVPGADGRAGMAAIVAGPDFSLDQLYGHLAARLPEYAIPLFLRFTSSIDTTATFKPRKQELMRDGFDPGRVKDPLYWLDRRRGVYEPIDVALHARLLTGGFGR